MQPSNLHPHQIRIPGNPTLLRRSRPHRCDASISSFPLLSLPLHVHKRGWVRVSVCEHVCLCVHRFGSHACWRTCLNPRVASRAIFLRSMGSSWVPSWGELKVACRVKLGRAHQEAKVWWSFFHQLLCVVVLLCLLSCLVVQSGCALFVLFCWVVQFGRAFVLCF